MHKLPITYTDYNGVERTEDFFFNLSESELAKLDLKSNGGLKDQLEAISASKDGKQIIEKFEEIIGWAYGIKSEDGRRFLKSPEILEDFRSSPAYDTFFMKLVMDAEFAASFIRAIVPQNLGERIASLSQEDQSRLARERSEAQLQGFNRPKEGADIPTVGSSTSEGLSQVERAELEELRRLQRSGAHVNTESEKTSDGYSGTYPPAG